MVEATADKEEELADKTETLVRQNFATATIKVQATSTTIEAEDMAITEETNPPIIEEDEDTWDTILSIKEEILSFPMTLSGILMVQIVLMVLRTLIYPLKILNIRGDKQFFIRKRMKYCWKRIG